MEPNRPWGYRRPSAPSKTWEAVNEGGGVGLEPTLEESLYEAGGGSAETEDQVRTLVLGHNPTMALLAALLDDGQGDDDAANKLSPGFPAGALVVFGYDGSSADLEASRQPGGVTRIRAKSSSRLLPHPPPHRPHRPQDPPIPPTKLPLQPHQALCGKREFHRVPR